MALFNKKTSDYKVNETVISKNCFFEGIMEAADIVVIEGGYIGNNLKADKIVIAEKGLVKTNIYANILVLQGTLIGNVHANTRIILETTARLAGDITSPELISSEGVFFEGNCKIIKNNEILQNNEPISKVIRRNFHNELNTFNSLLSEEKT